MSKYCTFCGSTEHDISLCPHTWDGSIKRANLYCVYCGSKTHSVKYCPKTWDGCMNRRNDSKGDFID